MDEKNVHLEMRNLKKTELQRIESSRGFQTLLLYLRLPVALQILHGNIEVGKRVDKGALDSLS